MKMEKQVPSAAICKKMRDAGIDFGDTAFVWALTNVWYKVYKFVLYSRNSIHGDVIIPAPTPSEMMHWLPYKLNVNNFYLGVDKLYKHYSAYYSDCLFESFSVVYEEKNIQDALAKLCLWVNKEGYK